LGNYLKHYFEIDLKLQNDPPTYWNTLFFIQSSILRFFIKFKISVKKQTMRTTKSQNLKFIFIDKDPVCEVATGRHIFGTG